MQRLVQRQGQANSQCCFPMSQRLFIHAGRATGNPDEAGNSDARGMSGNNRKIAQVANTATWCGRKFCDVVKVNAEKSEISSPGRNDIHNKDETIFVVCCRQKVVEHVHRLVEKSENDAAARLAQGKGSAGHPSCLNLSKPSRQRAPSYRTSRKMNRDHGSPRDRQIYQEKTRKQEAMIRPGFRWRRIIADESTLEMEPSKNIRSYRAGPGADPYMYSLTSSVICV